MLARSLGIEIEISKVVIRSSADSELENMKDFEVTISTIRTEAGSRQNVGRWLGWDCP
jgi:hypothetical protein